MLRRVVRFALRQRLLILGLTVALALIGLRSFSNLSVEAFPDVEDVRVQVISQWRGHAAEEIEKLVTLPLERQFGGLPGLTNLRSTSMFGLSVVTLTFEDGTTDYFARQQTLERLQGANLPANVAPGLASLSNSTGEIFRYTVSGKRPLTELKAIEDWVVEPAFRTVPGIADVVSFGGALKQYQVELDADKLQNYGISLQQVEQAIANANLNAGGGYIEHGFEKQVVRGVGTFGSLDDIARVSVQSRGGVPVTIADLGAVRIGGAPREGIVAKDSLDDVVQGIVLMRKGLNALQVLERVREKAAALNATILPKDVRLVPFYDRANLVRHTVRTVEENLAIGAALVLVILVVFLGDWRSATIVGLVIPLSLLAAFILMDLENVSANLISLGAVDFGIIVDAAVVMVEAFIVRLAMSPPRDGDLHRREFFAHTAEQMGRPILFSKAIVITAFLPIFTFQRVEKRIFSPMAFTLSFALLASLLLTLTFVPVLASLWLRVAPHAEEPAAARWLQRRFAPLLDFVLARPKRTLAAALTALAISMGIATRLGTEFLPALDEGNIWLTVTMPVGISMTQAKDIERQVRGVIRSYPEVTQVIAQLGRPDDGTDAKGSNNLEVYADLRPRGEWTTTHDKDALVALMSKRLEAIPGIDLNFSQYIKDNVDEALSGVKGELVVKLFGPDLQVLQQKAEEIRAVLDRVDGVADLGVEQQFGQPQIRFEFDRAALARHNVQVSDAADAVETAIGGRAVTQFLEGDRVFDLTVRVDSAHRDNPRALEHIPVFSADGHAVPLGALGTVVHAEGASRIAREANERRIAIKCSVRGRDEGGFVREAQHLVEKEVSLPAGYRAVWGGQFENQRRATARLAVIVPASIALIFLLLFSAFGSVKYATLILANLPFALIGGIGTLWLREIHLSVSAAVGFIALFGICVQNGVLLVSAFNHRREQGEPMLAAVREGTLERLRPVVMTALMAALGLLPAALSKGIGAETTRPFASVIVGGLITATVLTLTLLPILYVMFHEDPHEEIAR